MLCQLDQQSDQSALPIEIAAIISSSIDPSKRTKTMRQFLQDSFSRPRPQSPLNNSKSLHLLDLEVTAATGSNEDIGVVTAISSVETTTTSTGSSRMDIAEKITDVSGALITAEPAEVTVEVVQLDLERSTALRDNTPKDRAQLDLKYSNLNVSTGNEDRSTETIFGLATQTNITPIQKHSRNALWDALYESLGILKAKSKQFSPLSDAIESLILCLGEFEETTRNVIEYEDLAVKLTSSSNSLHQTIDGSSWTWISDSATSAAISIENQVQETRNKLKCAMIESPQETSENKEELRRRFRQIEVHFQQLHVTKYKPQYEEYFG
ncbi:hypothetical protein RSOLAG22IIIB_13798 [Rhizoctonia solani]|uniref:Uncharacterized protein n=1 Tax=Rhizoctonia solani TaxID=456999 RepID=A0A0K6FRP6_9AGAM|nr:hypothetical protein RSOLAG22IIIB_13798 [Rhizoctonia solani]